MKNIKIPLWFALTVPFSVLCLALFSWLMLDRTQEIVRLIDDKGRVALESSTDEVKHEITRYLDLPFLLQTSLADNLVRQGLLGFEDLTKAQAYMGGVFSDLYLRNHKQLEMVQVGTERGEFVGFRREPDGQVTSFLKDRRTLHQLYQYKPNSADIAKVIAPYDPRPRPWYVPVKRSFEDRWSDIYYSSTDPPYIAISATSPVLSQVGKLLGVMSTDVSLSDLSDFLKRTVLHKQYTSNLLYIVDTKGRLIASTRSPKAHPAGMDSSPSAMTLAAEAEDGLTRTSFEWVKEYLLHSSSLPNHHFKLDTAATGTYFGHTVKFDDGRGLTWHVVALVSERELTGTVKENAVRTLATSLIAGACLLLLLTVIVVKRFVRPIEETARGAARLAEDAGSGIALPDGGIIRETASLTQAFNTMSREIQQQVHKLHELAMRDPTTGTYNRIGLLSLAKWNGACAVSVLCIGIDNFKLVNASLGPEVGDRFLQEAAQRLSQAFAQHAWVGRLGGDEFLVVQQHQEPAQEQQLLAERVRTAFSAPFVSDTDELELSACIGMVSTVAQSGQLASELLHQASVSLRHAKAEGAGKTVVFETHLLEDAKHKTHLLTELKAALVNDEFLVYFQPIVQLKTLEVHGMEALIRWQSPSRGLVGPGEFIPLIEESGLIVEVGAWVMRQATQEMAEWIRQHATPPDFTLHVNVSVRQLVQSDFVQTVKRAITDSGLAPRVLMVEVTESMLMNEDSPILSAIADLREMGVGIALDDFGTGYSSLSYLYRFPFHALKIDRSFVLAAQGGEKTEAILKAVVDITQVLKVDAVAEGVETESQAEMLRKLDTGFAQGFLFGRPAPLQQAWAPILAKVNDRETDPPG